MARKTYADIEKAVDVSDVIEKAESKWRDKQTNRNKFAKFLDRFLKYSIPVIALILYAQSAPHTADIANRITKHFGVFAPAGFELLIFVLAASIDRGLKRNGIKAFLRSAIVLTAFLNIGGGMISVIESSTGAIADLSIQEILMRFVHMPFVDQFLFIIVIPLGIFVVLSAKLLAEISVGFVTGEIQINNVSDDIDLKWMQERLGIIRTALYLEASRKGMPPALSQSWSEKKANALCGYEDEPQNDAISNVPESPYPVPSNTAFAISSMGFYPEIKQTQVMGKAEQLGNGIGLPKNKRLSREEVIEWFDQNEEAVAKIFKKSLKKRARSKWIARAMGYDPESAYKTVERALDDRLK